MSITFLPKAYFIGPHLKQVSKVFEPQHMFKSVRSKTKQMFHGSITTWELFMSTHNICSDGQ